MGLPERISMLYCRTGITIITMATTTIVDMFTVIITMNIIIRGVRMNTVTLPMLKL